MLFQQEVHLRVHPAVTAHVAARTAVASVASIPAAHATRGDSDGSAVLFDDEWQQLRLCYDHGVF